MEHLSDREQIKVLEHLREVKRQKEAECRSKEREILRLKVSGASIEFRALRTAADVSAIWGTSPTVSVDIRTATLCDEEREMTYLRPQITLQCGFEAIMIPDNYFRKDPLSKGKELVAHIFNVQEQESNSSIEIAGRCIRTTSLNEPPYVIYLLVDPAMRLLQGGHCNCTAGTDATCKHAAALCQFINSERQEACTDQSQKWSTPSAKLLSLYPKGETIEEMITGM